MDFSKLFEVLIVVLFTSSGQLLLRTGMRNFITDEGIGSMITFIIQNPTLWLAIGLYAVSTLLWMRVLSKYPVGSVYPMVAIGYVFVTIGGVLFLSEKVPVQGWIALAVICFGTLLLAATPWQESNS